MNKEQSKDVFHPVRVSGKFQRPAEARTTDSRKNVGDVNRNTKGKQTRVRKKTQGWHDPSAELRQPNSKSKTVKVPTLEFKRLMGLPWEASPRVRSVADMISEQRNQKTNGISFAVGSPHLTILAICGAVFLVGVLGMVSFALF